MFARNCESIDIITYLIRFYMEFTKKKSEGKFVYLCFLSSFYSHYCLAQWNIALYHRIKARLFNFTRNWFELNKQIYSSINNHLIRLIADGIMMFSWGDFDVFYLDCYPFYLRTSLCVSRHSSFSPISFSASYYSCLSLARSPSLPLPLSFSPTRTLLGLFSLPPPYYPVSLLRPPSCYLCISNVAISIRVPNGESIQRTI